MVEPAPADPDRQLEELCRVLNHFGVRYVVFGSHVARLNGVAVETVDVDLVPDRERENLDRLAEASTSSGPVEMPSRREDDDEWGEASDARDRHYSDELTIHAVMEVGFLVAKGSRSDCPITAARGCARIRSIGPAPADAAAVGRSPSSSGTSDSWHRTIEAVSATDPIVGKDLVVADDGSIPADQIARLGLRPGALLRVIESGPVASEPSGLAGSLPDFPDLDWEAFARGSTLARSDLSTT